MIRLIWNSAILLSLTSALASADDRFQIQSDSYFERLGISDGAARDDVVNAYMDAVKVFARNTPEFVRIQEAYDGLTVSTLRILYDDAQQIRISKKEEAQEVAREKSLGNKGIGLFFLGKPRNTTVLNEDEQILAGILRDLGRVKTNRGISDISNHAHSRRDRHSDFPRYQWSEEQKARLRQAVNNTYLEHAISTPVPEERAQALISLWYQDRDTLKRALSEIGDGSLLAKAEIAMGIDRHLQNEDGASDFIRAAIWHSVAVDLKKQGAKGRLQELRKSRALRHSLGWNGSAQNNDVLLKLDRLIEPQWKSRAELDTALAAISDEMDPSNPQNAERVRLLGKMVASNFEMLKRITAPIQTSTAIRTAMPESCPFGDLGRKD